MDYVGDDVETKKKILSVQKCAEFSYQSKTLRSQDAHFWTYDRNTKMCKVKGLTNTRTPNGRHNRFVSGSVECGKTFSTDFGE